MLHFPLNLYARLRLFFGDVILTRTSIRVSDDTYRMIIKTRGIFEQMFKRKLSLDDTVYLSSRLISFIYETVQKLQAQERIAITELPDGSLKVEGLKSVDDVVLEVINVFTEINKKLAEKEKEISKVEAVNIQE
jgi:hypothetical protein